MVPAPRKEITMTGQAGQDDESSMPYVDGTHTSSEALRARVAREADPHYRDVQEAREQLEATVDELAARFDVRPRLAGFVQRWWPGLLAAAALLALSAFRRKRTSRQRRSPE
jgi:uncharacterized protein DUF3618